MGKIFYLLIFLIGIYGASVRAANTDSGVLIDALLARVGHESVSVSDLIRFEEISNIMHCAELRVGNPALDPEQAFNISLSRYIEEELVFIEARGKKLPVKGMVQAAVNNIHKKKNCQRDWQNLAKRFSTLWSSVRRPREGEGMLVRELEKRLLIDLFVKTQMKMDRTLWVREAKVKIPIKLYLD